MASNPSTPGMESGALPLPPLNLPPTPSGAAGAAAGGGNSMLASLVSGLGPVQAEVEKIQASAKRIAQLGIGGPAVMQAAAQIVGLSQQIVSGAAQASLGPQSAQSPSQPGAGPAAPPSLSPPPAGAPPQPIGA